MSVCKKIFLTFLCITALILLKQPLFSNVGFWGLMEAVLYYGDEGAFYMLIGRSAASDHIYAVYGALWLIVMRVVVVSVIVLQIMAIVKIWKSGNKKRKATGWVGLAGAATFVLGALAVSLAFVSNNTFSLFDGGKYHAFFYEKPGAAAVGFLIVGLVQLISPFVARSNTKYDKDIFDLINGSTKK